MLSGMEDGYAYQLLYNLCAQMCVTAKRKDGRKAKEKTRKETRKGGGHLDRKPHEGDKLKLT